MLYFPLQNAPRERKKYPRLRGGLRTDGFILGSWSDHSRIGRALFQLFSVFFCQILGGYLARQALYLVTLAGVSCRSAHCK